MKILKYSCLYTHFTEQRKSILKRLNNLLWNNQCLGNRPGNDARCDSKAVAMEAHWILEIAKRKLLSNNKGALWDIPLGKAAWIKIKGSESAP